MQVGMLVGVIIVGFDVRVDQLTVLTIYLILG